MKPIHTSDLSKWTSIPSRLCTSASKMEPSPVSWHCTLHRPKSRSIIIKCIRTPRCSQETRCNVRCFPHPGTDIIADRIPDLDNLISIAKSLMDLFWSVSTNPLSADEHPRTLVEKHGIERDICAFCYTFSILLRLASDENIAEREEELRDISLKILGILPSEDDTEFVAKSTRTTYKQLVWQGFDADRLIGIVDESLVPRLEVLQNKVNEGHNYSPRN